MTIRCPNCGQEVVVDGIGRPRRPIGVQIVLNALEEASGNYHEAAKILRKESGDETISPGFVWHRVTEYKKKQKGNAKIKIGE